MKKETDFGTYFKQKRIEKGFTLREFCREYKLDPGNTSKLERGMLPPPDSREKLEEYAGFLGLSRGSDDWYRFFDLAAAVKGIIPQDLVANEDLMASLPIIFRTFRNKKVTKKAVEELVDKIKNT